ncbi:hypothetical protein [Saccharicrinis fermentans]|nr:hypothetical protein [Saccharicrinis fermentans]
MYRNILLIQPGGCIRILVIDFIMHFVGSQFFAKGNADPGAKVLINPAAY